VGISEEQSEENEVRVLTAAACVGLWRWLRELAGG
jgi:hypothetical protein